MEEKQCKSAKHLNLIGDFAAFLGIILGFVYAATTLTTDDVVTFVVLFIFFIFIGFVIRGFARAVADIAENTQKAVSKSEPSA